MSDLHKQHEFFKQGFRNNFEKLKNKCTSIRIYSIKIIYKHVIYINNTSIVVNYDVFQERNCSFKYLAGMGPR